MKQIESPIQVFDRLLKQRKPPKTQRSGDPLPPGFTEISKFLWDVVWKKQLFTRPKTLLLLGLFTVKK